MKPRSLAHRPCESRPTRDVILDAAERRFAERGFAGVSVREIASDAGLKNQASLYHHFKNKKALYEAVLSRGVEPIIDMVASAQMPGDVADPVIDRMVDYLAARPHLPRLIQRAGLDDTKLLRSTVTKLLGPLYTHGLRVLAGTGGDWDPSEMPHLAAGLYHLIFGYFANAALLETVLPEDPRSPAALARQAHFLKMAVARLLGPAAAHAGRGRVQPTARAGGTVRR
jgi:AcrR family transcriptional regulator